MRGHDEQTHDMFSYLSPEQRVPADHPLRAVRTLTDQALKTMSRRFASLYAKTGRPSIAPEHLLRALLLQVLYTVRSERLLMEELNDTLLFRWFVGLNMDDPVWHPPRGMRAITSVSETETRGTGLWMDEDRRGLAHAPASRRRPRGWAAHLRRRGL